MNIITLRICSLTSRSDVLTIASSQLYYLLLFWWFWAPHPRVREVRSFVLSLLLSAVRIDSHKSAAKLLCPPQVGSIEDESTATVNSKARLSCRRKNDLHHTSIKFVVFCTSSQPKQKKDATTMTHMNLILIATLKDNINYDILSRNCFLIHYFVLFQLHQSLEWILEFMIFQLFWLMRANGNEIEAKLLCRVQIGRQEDRSTVVANFQAIFFGP